MLARNDGGHGDWGRREAATQEGVVNKGMVSAGMIAAPVAGSRRNRDPKARSTPCPAETE